MDGAVIENFTEMRDGFQDAFLYREVLAFEGIVDERHDVFAEYLRSCLFFEEAEMLQ